MASSLLTVNVLLNNSVTTELLGSANGLGMTCAGLGRLDICQFVMKCYSIKYCVFIDLNNGSFPGKTFVFRII